MATNQFYFTQELKPILKKKLRCLMMKKRVLNF